MKKTQLAPAPFPVEGSGSQHFSNFKMYATIAVMPLMFNLALGFGLWYYPAFLLIFAFPSFCVFHLYTSLTLAPTRPQKNLPGRNMQDYFEMKHSSVKKYSNRRKIPMETFFEAYFDDKIDLKDDMLQTLEARYDWATFSFTISQATFFLTQWVPETLWHSKKQDQDQVRDHYDRGDDFYNWFCIDLLSSGSHDDLY
jgi:hypothetical protein